MLNFDISNLSEGLSVRDVNILPKVVDLNNNPEFQQEIELYYEINKVGHEIFVKVTFQTKAELLCDRCLESFAVSLEQTIDLVLTSDEHILDREEEDIYMITKGTTSVDITESIRQNLLLALPVKKVCSTDCRGLCPQCGQNLNIKTCSCTHDTIDARWEALKQIKFK